MILRRLSADDTARLRALWLRGLREVPEAFLLTPDELCAMADSAFAANIDKHLFIGAFDKDTLIGFVVARRGGVTRLMHTADIGPLYVAPSHQRRGHARALMRAAMDQLAQDGVLQCELTLDAQNTAARLLYTDLGFTLFGRRPRSVIIDGQPRDDLLMIRALDGADLDDAPTPA